MFLVLLHQFESNTGTRLGRLFQAPGRLLTRRAICHKLGEDDLQLISPLNNLGAACLIGV